MKKRTIIGLAVIAAAVATMFAAPAVASATSPQYVMAIWKNPVGSPKFPQGLVTSYKTTSTDPNILAKYATECGTFYQSDIYADDERTAKLIAGKVLRGGDESWPLDAKGDQIQRYTTLTTDPCPVVVTPPPVVTPPVVTPEPTPPVVTPIPVPPVTTPEVPSSPVTPAPSVSPTAPTTPPTPGTTTTVPSVTPVSPTPVQNVAPSQRTAQTCQQVGPNVKTTDRNLDADGDGIGCETQRIAPVPTPIRTEAKFTG